MELNILCIDRNNESFARILAAILNAHSDSQVKFSADSCGMGCEIDKPILPVAAQVLEEMGIPIPGSASQDLADIDPGTYDHFLLTTVGSSMGNIARRYGLRTDLMMNLDRLTGFGQIFGDFNDGGNLLKYATACQYAVPHIMERLRALSASRSIQ